MTTEEFSKLIKDKRIKLNLTQKELGDKLGVSNKTISRWESSHGYPDIETIPKLAQVLELNYDELLGGNEYILMKLKDKRKTRIAIIIMFLIFSLIIGIGLYQESQGFHTNYHGRDLLVSKDLLSTQLSLDFRVNDRGGGYWYSRYDEIIRKTLLESIDIDNIAETTDEETRTFINEYKDGKIYKYDYYKLDFMIDADEVLSLTIYLIDNKSYYFFSNINVTRNHIPNDEFFESQENELYCLDYRLEINTEVFNEFDYDHQIKNDSNILKELNESETDNILSNDSIGYQCNGSGVSDGLFLKYNETGKQYYIIKSNTMDYTDINTINDQGTLRIQCKANDRMYFQTYIHIFEILEPVGSYVFEVNGEVISSHTIEI